MKFGLFGGAKSAGEGSVGDSLGYRKYIDYVLHAEELGYHSVFVVEHHFTGVGQLSASLNFLSYLAGRTNRIRLGTAVVVLPWHNPVLLAEQVATLDLLSNGRLDFGVGKGYRPPEFAGFCIPIEEATERFDETIAFLRKAWTAGDRFSHHGKRWRFENVVIEPRARAAAASAAVDGSGQLRVDPPRRAGGVQSSARPDCAGRLDHRARRSLPRGAWEAGPPLPVRDKSAWPAPCRSFAPRRSDRAPMR